MHLIDSKGRDMLKNWRFSSALLCLCLPVLKICLHSCTATLSIFDCMCFTASNPYLVVLLIKDVIIGIQQTAPWLAPNILFGGANLNHCSPLLFLYYDTSGTSVPFCRTNLSWLLSSSVNTFDFLHKAMFTLRVIYLINLQLNSTVTTFNLFFSWITMTWVMTKYALWETELENSMQYYVYEHVYAPWPKNAGIRVQWRKSALSDTVSHPESVHITVYRRTAHQSRGIWISQWHKTRWKRVRRSRRG